MAVEIIDNFVEQQEFNNLKEIIFSNDFAWYSREKMTDTDSHAWFIHCFYNTNAIRSEYFPLLKNILDKLNVASIVQIRTNLMLKQHKHYQSGRHIDYDYNGKTAILYLNKNNGTTLIYNKNKIQEIQPIENRMIIFDNRTEHVGQFPTDVKRRIVINFNYFEK